MSDPAPESAAPPDVELRVEEQVPEQVDIGRKFADWRTLASFGIALVILAIALKKSGVTPSDLGSALGSVNPWIFASAFVVYYTSFPLRTLRWRMLMDNATSGQERRALQATRFRDLVEILYLSWFANCVVPAKLGDVYRAYLTRTSVGISASRTVGTILAERVLDLLVLFPMLLIAAFLTFRDHLLADSTMRNVLLGALVLGAFAAFAVLMIWRLGEGLRNFLPQRVHHVYTAFREGAIHSFRRNMAALFGLTVLVWACEGGRLFLVLLSLGWIEPGRLGPSAALFLALGSSVLTTIPFAPGGLGLVEGFLIASLKALRHGANGGQAVALALLDRIISYLSIVVIGFFLYAFSKKTRDALRRPTSGTQPPALASLEGGAVASLAPDRTGTRG